MYLGLPILCFSGQHQESLKNLTQERETLVEKLKVTEQMKLEIEVSLCFSTHSYTRLGGFT